MAVIRNDPTISPGENIPQNADFTEVLPEGADIEGVPAINVVARRGSGTLTVSEIAKQGRVASYKVACSSNALTGSVFDVIARATSANGTFEVATRITVI